LGPSTIFVCLGIIKYFAPLKAFCLMGLFRCPPTLPLLCPSLHPGETHLTSSRINPRAPYVFGVPGHYIGSRDRIGKYSPFIVFRPSGGVLFHDTDTSFFCFDSSRMWVSQLRAFIGFRPALSTINRFSLSRFISPLFFSVILFPR